MRRNATFAVLLCLGGTLALGFVLGYRQARAHPAFAVWKLQTAEDPADRRAAAVDLARRGNAALDTTIELAISGAVKGNRKPLVFGSEKL